MTLAAPARRGCRKPHGDVLSFIVIGTDPANAVKTALTGNAPARVGPHLGRLIRIWIEDRPEDPGPQPLRRGLFAAQNGNCVETGDAARGGPDAGRDRRNHGPDA
jgi:hypothetical protein